MNAREIMTAPVVTVTPRTALKDAVGVLLHHRVSGLPVVDDAGRLVGIVTEADLLLKEAEEVRPEDPNARWLGGSLWLERLVSGHSKLVGRTVGEVMTHNVITALEETPVHVLASRMVRFKVNRLPITRSARVVGIVTRADVLKVFLRPDEDLTSEARRLIGNFPLADESAEIVVERGVLALKGRVRSRERRVALLQRLDGIDGLVAVDDHALEDDGTTTHAPAVG
jgi:CBS domain-containing protein